MSSLEWFDVVGRLALAAGLGGVLGLEREYGGQDAGLRTHMLVVLGAALFGVVSVAGFDAYVDTRADTNVTVDVTRVAAYVAPGIGFIGGGAILKYGGKVTGITTAASLWTAAAVGVAAGLGLWVGAVAATVIALIALEALKPASGLAARLGRRRNPTVQVALDASADLAEVLGIVQRMSSRRIREVRYGRGPDDEGEVTIRWWRSGPDSAVRDLVAELSSTRGVTEVTTDPE